MDKVKDPSMLLSVVNSIGLVGVTVYFYKQLETIRMDLVKITQNLSGILRKVLEIEKSDHNKNEVIRSLSEQIRKLSEQMEELPSLDLENLEINMEEIINTLEENGINVGRINSNYRTIPRFNKNLQRKSTKRNKIIHRNNSFKKLELEPCINNTNTAVENLLEDKSIDKLQDDFNEQEILNEARKTKL
ncbi:MAG: hypothetical protein QXV60_00710 [Nitrososphaerota archaeon]